MPKSVHLLTASLTSAAHAAQELARQNNESAAMHHAYLSRRTSRKLGFKFPGALKFSKIIQDRLDWVKAEREARPICAVGFFLPR